MSPSGGDLVIGDAQPPSLEAPDIASPDLGANPLTIDGEVTLDPLTPVLGDDGETEATGLWVTDGALLRVDTSETPGLILSFPAGIRIDGALELHPQLTDSGGFLGLNTPGRAVVTGVIDTSGLEGGGTAAVISLVATEALWVRGELRARGSEGDVGGRGNMVILQSDGPVVCNASIDTSGGRGLVEAGGDAGPMQLLSGPESPIHLSGRATAVGGDGGTAGGLGGMLILQGQAVFSSAPVVAPGGTAITDGTGGRGGGVVTTASNGPVVFTGSVTAPGGGGAGEGEGAVGGLGGQVRIIATGSGPGPLAFVSGEIEISGGTGPAGGQGGEILVVGVLPPSPTAPLEGPAVAMPRFAAIDVSGGGGSAAGGRGGSILVLNSPVVIEEQTYAGETSVEADLLSAGGSGGTGDGGQGGVVMVQVEDLACRDLSADGGSSTDATGGAGGSVQILAPRGKVTYDTARATGGPGAIAQGEDGSVFVQSSELYITAQGSGP